MSTMTDAFGRTIGVTINQDGEDVYTLAGITVAFPTGTPQARAIASIEGMAPAGYTPPQVNYTFLQFMALFSAAEQAAIVGSADTQVRLFCLMASSAGLLQLTNPEIVAALEYLAATNQNPAPAAAWAASTAVTVGEQVAVGTNVYTATTAGTTGTKAPSGTGSAIADGTAVWNYTPTPYLASSARIAQIQAGTPQ